MKETAGDWLDYDDYGWRLRDLNQLILEANKILA